jgi:hypothetical protein
MSGQEFSSCHLRRRVRQIIALVALSALPVPEVSAGPAWAGYGGDAQHNANASAGSQPLQGIRWQTPVDLNPQFSGNDLLIHYGSPMVTQANTVIVPVKTGATDGFQLSAFDGTTGSLKWTQATDYTLAPHNWTPSYSPTLTPSNALVYAGAGGTVYSRATPDSTTGAVSQTAFYGNAAYAANPSAYNGSVFVNTPITSDASGNVYFGYRVTGSAPNNLQNGIARIGANGVATYTPVATAAGDASMNQVVQNCAPAVSRDGSKIYVAVSNGFNGSLIAINSSTLAPVASVSLRDPRNNGATGALLDNDGSASPTVGPDGDVYMGVLEQPFPDNHDRGWLLHFSGDLGTTKTPGAFGWDDTASVVPASMVPSYHGLSSYLLMSKYNNYANDKLNGDGVNKLAILDPNDTEIDPVTSATVMKEVLTIAGVTPDLDFPNKPGAVREWCINSAAVDPATDSILANSEDGKLYRWNLTSNAFTQVVTLTPGVGEAYTPTIVGADGTVYAINNATLFGVGSTPEPATALLAAGGMLLISMRRRRRARHV